MYLKGFGQPVKIRGMSEEEEEGPRCMLLLLVQMFSRGTRLGSQSRNICWIGCRGDVHINFSLRFLTKTASG